MSVHVLALGPGGFGSYEMEWGAKGPELRKVSASAELLLAPGFVDVHIHGAFGVDFMTASGSQMATACSKLQECGYEALLATTVSSDAAAVLSAVRAWPKHPLIAGFHLEGPFLSLKHPGAQPAAALIAPASAGEEWEPVLAHSALKLITLAPELPGADELISRLASRGVTVSMGHSDATFAQAEHAERLGARSVTHTFNAMRGFHHREPGLAGYALLSRTLATEIIYDRLHVSRPGAELLLRARPKNKLVAVSDGTMASGIPDGRSFEMWGSPVEVRSGGVFLRGTDTLSGSAITLLQAFQNLAADFGPEVAIRACCVNPRSLAGLRGKPAIHLLLNSRWELLEVRPRPDVRGT